jgi:DNA-nicking Smr family endonuclease
MPDDKLSDEDKALFRQMMQAVKPLKHTQWTDSKVKKPSEKPLPKTHFEDKPTSTYSLSNHYTNVVNSETILVYCKQSIPRSRLNQLKKGEIPFQARIDLHGLKPEAACDSLCRFIEKQYNLGSRCLLIIHGKGGLRGEAPILKNHVNHWLPQLPHILAFHSALPRDGGCGALYVLLKRQRY